MINSGSIDGNVNLTIVSSECGDWYALYVDGVIECQGHNLYIDDWCDLIRKYRKFSGNVEFFTVFDSFCEKIGHFPDKFEDLKKECFM